MSVNKIFFTPREIEIMKYLVQGKSNREIANVLFLSCSTVKFYISSILSKMGVRSRIEVAVEIVKNNII